MIPDKLYYEHLKDFSSTEGYWSNEDCIKVARDILDTTKAKTMLEIGFNIGYSASTWLQQGIDNLIVLDIGYHKDTLPAIKATATHYNTKQVKWWIGDSTSEEAKELDMPNIDISFIDGEHTYRAAVSDTELSLRYGADWLVYDDVIDNHPNGIDKAINKFVDEEKIKIVNKYPMSWIGQGDVVLCKVLK